MLKTITVLFIALCLIQGVIAGKAFSEGTTAASQQGVIKTVPQQEAEMPAELKKSIMRKEEKGLDLARSAIEMADPYPNLKESVKAKTEEMQEFTRKKTALQTMIQRTKVDMNKKAAEFANNPRMLEITKKLYTKKINEMKQDYSEIEQLLPKLNTELAENTIELQAEELTRAKDENPSDNIDDTYQKAMNERFEKGAQILNSINLFKPYR